MGNPANIVAGLVLILVGTWAVIEAIGLRVGTPTEPQPGFFPFLSGAFIIILSSIILAQGFFGHSKTKVSLAEMKRPALLVAVLAVSAAILEPLGYVITSFVVVALVLLIMRIKSWRVVLVTSLALSIGTFLLFGRLLGITLPTGILSALGL